MSLSTGGYGVVWPHVSVNDDNAALTHTMRLVCSVSLGCMIYVCAVTHALTTAVSLSLAPSASCPWATNAHFTKYISATLSDKILVKVSSASIYDNFILSPPFICSCQYILCVIIFLNCASTTMLRMLFLHAVFQTTDTCNSDSQIMRLTQMHRDAMWRSRTWANRGDSR
jgi:hypothetical protein